MAMSRALAQVQRAVEKRARAEQATRDAQRELEEAIRAAHSAGESYSAIGRVVGVSRQRIAQIVGGDASPGDGTV